MLYENPRIVFLCFFIMIFNNALGMQLRSNNSLTKLKAKEYITICKNNITNEAILYIEEELKSNLDLNTLNINFCNLNDDQVKSLAKILIVNKTLMHLNLNDNKIGNEGAKALADMLKVNTSLKSLSLSNNPLGENGICYISHALNENKSLEILNLKKVKKLNDSSIKCLAKTLRNNENLCKLDISHCSLGVKGLNILLKCLKSNFSVTNIIYHNRQVSANFPIEERLLVNQYLKSITIEIDKALDEHYSGIDDYAKIVRNKLNDLDNNTIRQNIIYFLIEKLNQRSDCSKEIIVRLCKFITDKDLPFYTTIRFIETMYSISENQINQQDLTILQNQTEISNIINKLLEIIMLQKNQLESFTR
jgi:hypothetical protein